MMKIPILENMLVRVEDKVAILTFNRKASGNPLHPALLKDYLAAMLWANECDAVRVVLQTGQGRFYSTGKELIEEASGDSVAATDAYIKDFRALNEALINSKKVLIAAVNGPAIGYGTTSLALYDLVYSVPGAYFFTPFMKWGFCAEGCSSLTFAKIMGRQKASSLLLAGERMTAQELADAGLITKIYDKESMFKEAQAIATRIANYPPKAVEFTKSLMTSNWHAELIATNVKECTGLRERFLSKESLDAVADFARDQQKRRDRSML